MSNNSSNYQEYTFSKLLEQYDKILVPMIQRDYAQGRTDDKKAEDVRNNLLNDIFSDKDVHFDLVFGSKEKRIIDGKEMNCFIPVDGQQRLTTLFLLYLYGQKAGKTNTELDLSKFSYDTRRAASDFCKSITSEEWAVPNDKKVSDVIKDSSWFMNYWEKDPTVEGMLNMLDAIHDKNNGTIVYPDLSKVKFYFFDLESNGLNENLYLKMNSRGKPLTAFENLKAKIEKVLPDITKVDNGSWFPSCNAAPEDFKGKWKYFMDRDWTEAFWDQEHPEKYDESITKFIVRFLSGYWAAYGKDDEQMNDELKSLNSKDSYADFIPFEPIKKVLDLEKAFSTLAYAMTTVPEIKPYWTNDTIKVSDQSEYKFLAVIFTYILFDGDKDAMRLAWNMAENYVTGYDTFVTYCKRVKEICDKFNSAEDNAFYKALSDNNYPNPSEQLKEEIAKAQQILDENGTLRRYNGSCQKADGSNYQTWEEIIIDAEKYAFFKGAIRFLFTDENGEVNDESWGNFDIKWEYAQKFFEKDGNGVTTQYETENALLRTLISYFEKKEHFQEPYYDNTHWRSILLDKKLSSPVCSLLTKECISDFKEYTPNCNDPQLALVQKQLVETDLIDNLPKEGYYMEDDLKLHVYYGHRETTDIYLGDSVHENHILADLVKQCSVSCDQRLKATFFFFGRNINFKYNKYFFRWYGFPNEKKLDIYLMEDNWTGCKKRQNPTNEKGTDEDVYFCFRVDENTTSDIFTKMLDCLIHQAEANKQNKPCYVDCKNKVCE